MSDMGVSASQMTEDAVTALMLATVPIKHLKEADFPG